MSREKKSPGQDVRERPLREGLPLGGRFRGSGRVLGMATEANPYKKALESFAARNGLWFEVEPYDEYPSGYPGEKGRLRWASAVVFDSGSGSVARDRGPTEEDACRRLAEVLAWRAGISLAEFLVREDVNGC